MSGIEQISAALKDPYDAVCWALVRGSFADAARIAAVIADARPVGDESAPESCPTVPTLPTEV